MITIAVVAVVAAIAIPSFTDQIRNNRSVSIANEFIETMSFARVQAASRPARVTVCASKDGTTCTGSWEEGYIVFVDTAATDTTTPPEIGEILKYIQKAKGDVEMVAAYGSTAASFIRFTPTGTLARIDVNPLIIKTKITRCKGNYARVIGVTLAGQTTVTPQDCSEAF